MAFASLIASIVEPTGSSCEPKPSTKSHHDHRNLRIARFLQQAADAVGGVDHRVWLTIGEVVIAEIEEGVLDAVVDIAQAISRIRLNVAVNFGVFFQDGEHGFVAQSTAAEQAANVFLLRCELRTHVSNQLPGSAGVNRDFLA